MKLWMSILLATLALPVLAIEEPAFDLLEKQGEFELRAYKPRIVAETWMSGSLDEASGPGFRTLADYIFGNNSTGTGEAQEIAMTAPVTMQL